MRLRQRRGAAKPILYLLGFLAFFGWMFGDNSNEKPAKRASTPTERIQSPAEKSEVNDSKNEPIQLAKHESNGAPETTPSTWIYVTGSRVNMRDQPSLSGRRIGSYSQPTRLAYLGEEGDWVKVEHPTEQTTGWMHNDYLNFSAPKPPSAAKSLPKENLVIRKAAAVRPVVPSEAQIRQQIVSKSIRRYTGSCPCPFNTDRAGRKCGKRSAYSRPGGAAPICYVHDVTQEMIDRFR